jgi:hypothetical protein
MVKPLGVFMKECGAGQLPNGKALANSKEKSKPPNAVVWDSASLAGGEVYDYQLAFLFYYQSSIINIFNRSNNFSR